jgi:streptogramin lyase
LGSIAVDSIGDAWSVANSVDALTEVSPSGTLVGTYNGAGLTAPTSLAVDGLGQIWVTDTNNAISAFTNSGTAISPATGYQASTLNAPSAIAIDQSGSVWIANQGSSTVTRLIGAAAPVVTSTVSGVTQSTPGSRP